MNKKGFTLIELIGVITILGILLLITVPAVTGIIYESKESVYTDNVKTMITEVESLYNSKRFGALLDEDQLMVVPIKNITFENVENDKSPFDDYDLTKSVLIIEKTKYSIKTYASIIDKSDNGFFEVSSECLGRKEQNKNGKKECAGGGIVDTQDIDKYNTIVDYYTCDEKDYDVIDTVLEFKGEDYVAIEARSYEKSKCTSGDNPDKFPILIFEKDK